jgi:hypothetical protein
MLAMVIVPAGVTLSTVRISALAPAVATAPGSSPYGYTVSLLLFILPVLVIALWFIPHEDLKICRKSFWTTIALLVPIGASLDFFFARSFFLFPNATATLGIRAPALGSPVPLEEYVFYLTGFLCILLLYIWIDEYWLAAYSVPIYSIERSELELQLRAHYESIFLGVVLITAAIIYKKYISGSSGGFPGYFIFIVLTAFLPSSALLPMVRPVINWRAFSLASFFIVLVSLIWEVTLAIPYGWWNFRDAQMIGIHIMAWGGLPVEEVFLWLAVVYATVIVYETVKCFHSSGKVPARSFTHDASRRVQPANKPMRSLNE